MQQSIDLVFFGLMCHRLFLSKKSIHVVCFLGPFLAIGFGARFILLHILFVQRPCLWMVRHGSIHTFRHRLPVIGLRNCLLRLCIELFSLVWSTFI
jgi:hypothetical protein